MEFLVPRHAVIAHRRQHQHREKRQAGEPGDAPATIEWRFVQRFHETNAASSPTMSRPEMDTRMPWRMLGGSKDKDT